MEEEKECRIVNVVSGRVFVGRYPRMVVQLTEEGRKAYEGYRERIEGFLKGFE